MRLIPVVLALALSAGCASAPTAPPTSTAQPTAAPAVTVPAQPVAAPVVTAPEAGSAVLADNAAPVAGATAEDAILRTPPGYKDVNRNGVRYFCKNMSTLGSRFSQQICMTEDEYREVKRRGESVRSDLERSTAICASSAENACGMN